MKHETFRTFRGARLISLAFFCFFAALGTVLAPLAEAQDATTLIRLLKTGRDFRVRAQAAFALGNVADGRSLEALRAALKDSNEGVRAAAATSLGELGNPEAIKPLKLAAADTSETVRIQVVTAIERIRIRSNMAHWNSSDSAGSQAQPVDWQNVRYIVSLGTVANRSGFLGDGMTRILRDLVDNKLRVIDGIAIVGDRKKLDKKAKKEIQRRKIPEVRMEANLVRVDRRINGGDISIRCEVSLMLLDSKQSSLRGVLKGVATGQDTVSKKKPVEQEQTLAFTALDAAVKSAVARAPQALEQVAMR